MFIFLTFSILNEIFLLFHVFITFYTQLHKSSEVVIWKWYSVLSVYFFACRNHLNNEVNINSIKLFLKTPLKQCYIKIIKRHCKLKDISNKTSFYFGLIKIFLVHYLSVDIHFNVVPTEYITKL